MVKSFSFASATLALSVFAAITTGLAGSARAQSDEPEVLSRESIWNDPEIPALGNPNGDLTIVEYFDYQCPVCKRVHPELARAIRDDGKVRLVSKGWPIFGGPSGYAVRMVLAAKYQSKYAEAHEALFTAKVPLSEAVVRILFSKAGVDPVKAESDLEANRAVIDATLRRTQMQTAAFGFLGTPAFIIGTFRVNVGLSTADFKKAIADARVALAKQ